MNKKNKLRRDCIHYGPGGTFPPEQGARCLWHDKFFTRGKTRGKDCIDPDCAECVEFKSRETPPKQYAKRNIIELERGGGHYTRHVQAMTAEGLHSKSAIAAELAYRDREINLLNIERRRLEMQIEYLSDYAAKMERKARTYEELLQAEIERELRARAEKDNQ